ncbi:MAG: hypothetical protein ACRD0L_00370, partial [Acidimicrobiales bacterium]
GGRGGGGGAPRTGQSRRALARHGRAAGIVDTTGRPAVVVGATCRLADLGTLVLAGEWLGSPMPIDLYRDVHRRGLRLVGVGRPLPALALGETSPEAPRGLPGVLWGPPVAIRPNVVPPPGHWYRLSAS